MNPAEDYAGPYRPPPRSREKGNGPDADCPVCGRESCEKHLKAPPASSLIVQPARRFLAEAHEAPQWLIPDLVASGGITMFHGRPRSMKSLTALSLALDAALGLTPFHAERFVISRPVRAAYMTEEDSRGLVAARLHWLLSGHKTEPPETLWLSARKGLNLEQPESQTQIHDCVRTLELELAVLDTGRAFAASVDKGPSDAAGPIRFLRWLLTDTSLGGLVVVHHDVKPNARGEDVRARAEKASGGALLAAADCPVGFERLSERACLAVPDRYKPSSDPAPFKLTFESSTPEGLSFRDWLRVTATPSDERKEAEDRAGTAVLQVLQEADEWLSGNAAATRAGGRKQDAFAALKTLAAEGRILSRQGKRGKEYRHAP